ncbi:MAG: outer membrane beta-barrel protein [Candidatus Eisenbacteria bacterium]
MSGRHRAGCGIFVGVACLIAAGAAGAQDADRPSPGAPWAQERGFVLGLQYHTNVIGAEDPGEQSTPGMLFVDEVGHGMTFIAGYNFTPAFHLRLAASVARHETTQEAVEAHYDAGLIEAQWRFLPAERARPYVFGGIGGAGVGFDTDSIDEEVRGGAVSMGLGVLYSLTRHLVLDLNTRLDLINWNERRITQELPGEGTLELESPVDGNDSAWRFQLGMEWEF